MTPITATSFELLNCVEHNNYGLIVEKEFAYQGKA